MELIRGLHNLRPQHRGCVASIGNFDGVHRGHQAIVARLQEHAAATGLPARVVLFEPQPLEFFRPDAVEPRLMRLREKLAALAALGVDGVLCLHFDAQLAAMPREQFVERLLIQGLGVRQLVVGPDFRFGHKRLGDVEYLKTVGRSAAFGVEAMPPLLLDGERVSSTAVRRHLSGGDLAGAARLLGRPYTLHGRVSHGDERGRSIGFPTLNLPLRRKAVSLRGVFAVRVTGLADRPLPAVANLGVRPTVGGTYPLLEVHVLDFSGQVYGRQVQVEFVQQLRDERRFDGLTALRAQIDLDVRAARALFAKP
ncbi:bifunctional riboflavin kinase/FAD synthetase [Immundisolibacter sp.]|uniref:bifunctional riboflavin kinase/FAD synthetase n=1 Tax=Immundisolibacter sp. TaxID=1934948 RepID=UPI002B07A688|nr:bifunctional riboflavin kinase/FAD synthetase [Immundisolibacter sp.]MEA3220666.1 Bifunctional riboflavin kinase/FMN adenylyltransferase [Immundisolibacter sp.]